MGPGAIGAIILIIVLLLGGVGIGGYFYWKSRRGNSNSNAGNGNVSNDGDGGNGGILGDENVLVEGNLVEGNLVEGNLVEGNLVESNSNLVGNSNPVESVMFYNGAACPSGYEDLGKFGLIVSSVDAAAGKSPFEVKANYNAIDGWKWTHPRACYGDIKKVTDENMYVMGNTGDVNTLMWLPGTYAGDVSLPFVGNHGAKFKAYNTGISKAVNVGSDPRQILKSGESGLPAVFISFNETKDLATAGGVTLGSAFGTGATEGHFKYI